MVTWIIKIKCKNSNCYMIFNGICAEGYELRLTVQERKKIAQ